ncbi:hypothetical protein LUZ63_019745 [Rhynchospora breviuscula]|uniref:RING-type E3 ubiquitin transferase n=1 Tax=Rhynchospora breviuscula TaxID=2022672 RepID=A0A9Q0C705_9POAL|nr:hypothetical protein LUZ63_019745 [Rhynchospora breviuscula]
MALIFTNVLAITISIPYLTIAIMALGDDNFTKECPPSKCSDNGPVVRYPFRLNFHAMHCGYDNFVLYCSQGNTVLRPPSSGEYNVTSIDYTRGILTITRYSWTPCPWRNIDIANLTGSPFRIMDKMSVTWLDCPTMPTSISNGVVGPIYCLASDRQFIYVARDDIGIWSIPTNCKKINTSYVYADFHYTSDFQLLMSEFTARPQAVLHWEDHLINCSACEEKGHHCESNIETRKSFCSVKGNYR